MNLCNILSEEASNQCYQKLENKELAEKKLLDLIVM